MVVEHDQAWRLVAALAYGVERAHAQFLDFLLIEDFDLQALVGFAQPFGLVGQVAWVADVGWQVAQVTGEAHAGGYRRGVLDRARDVGGTGLVGQQGDFLQRARLGLLTLELVENVFTVEQGFSQ
ncbi:hypothetical protein D3C77_539080 [compost metagenome]